MNRKRRANQQRDDAGTIQILRSQAGFQRRPKRLGHHLQTARGAAAGQVLQAVNAAGQLPDRFHQFGEFGIVATALILAERHTLI
jgi:hypothetical protein